MTKRYCSHCGSPNQYSAKFCEKCGKPLNSALKASYADDSEEEVVVVKKSVKAKKIRYVDEDGNDIDDSFSIQAPSASDVIIETPQKFTVGSLRNGAVITPFGVTDIGDAEVQRSPNARIDL